MIKMSMDFEKYAEVASVILEGTAEKDYTERAYFAKTEDEARKILKEYQDLIANAENGVLAEYLEYVAELAKTNENAAF